MTKREMIAAVLDAKRQAYVPRFFGFAAVTTSVDTTALDPSFVGRLIVEELLARLPPLVGPCGENGEYHSFVFDTPLFSGRIPCTLGEIVLKQDRFPYCDFLPG